MDSGSLLLVVGALPPTDESSPSVGRTYRRAAVEVEN